MLHFSQSGNDIIREDTDAVEGFPGRLTLEDLQKPDPVDLHPEQQAPAHNCDCRVRHCEDTAYKKNTIVLKSQRVLAYLTYVFV